MDNLFSYDSKFFEVLSKITDIVILNLLCIISCVPIITIGASITATYSVAMKIVGGNDVSITKEFIKRFKENFKDSTKVWIIMLLIGIVLIFDLHMSKLVLNEAISKVLQLIFSIIGIIFVFTLSYVFPIMAKFENTIKNNMINSTLISIQNLPYTIVILIVNLSEVLLILLLSNYWGHILFFYTIMGFGLIAYINSMFFNKILNKYIK